MGDFATTSWLLFGILHLIFAAVAAGGLRGRGGFNKKAALGGIFKAFGVEDSLGLLNQVVEGFESSVDAGEADIGHLIEAAEALDDQFADALAGDFLVEAAMDLFFDFIHDLL